ncbi:MAG TPA: serine hydrolase [Gemmatimonadota bacterium]|nr:serine hydrolase [Gemmatimonadota bacterium]
MRRAGRIALPLVGLAACLAGPPPAALAGGALPAAGARGGGAPDRRSPLEDSVRAVLSRLPARATLFAKHLPDGRTLAIGADVPMNTASVIKIPVMVRAFRDAEAGRLDLDARTTVRPEDLRRGTGLLQTFQPGLRPTWRDLVTQMIVTSDNTATDMVIRRVGLERVNALLDSLGYRETRLRGTIGEAFRAVWVLADSANRALTDRQVYERGFPAESLLAGKMRAFVEDSSQWLGRTTAREMADLLERLQRGRLAGPASTEAMLGILRRQFYGSRLPRYLGGRAAVAHKTGDWPPFLADDVGILSYDGGPTVVAVFTNGNAGPYIDVERAIGRVAELLVDVWR